MSSIVAVRGTEGFVISSDRLIYKYVTDSSSTVIGKVRGTARKLFQLHDDVLAVGLGNWDSYFPMFNRVAGMGLPKRELLGELYNYATGLTDARVYVISRRENDVVLDIIEGGQVRLNASGAVMYPEPLLNALFLAIYESEPAMKIRVTGMLGIAALVTACNAFVHSLCSDIAAPFDTTLFLRDGIFNFSGGVTRLPTGEFS